MYRSRLDELRGRERRLQGEHLRLGYLRLAFGVALLLLLLPPRLYALLPLAAFVLAARIHGTTLRQLAEARRLLAFFERSLARVEDRRSGLQPRTTRLSLTESLFAADLDLFGPGSLFEVLCEARTSLGEIALGEWLLAPAEVPILVARQTAIAELRSRLPLRESFAAAGGPAVAEIDRAALAAWGRSALLPVPQFLLWLAPVLVALTLAAAWRFAVTHSPLLLLLATAVDASLTFAYGRGARPLLAEAQQVSRALSTAAELLAHTEAESFDAPGLQAIGTGLRTQTQSASQALARLATLSAWAEARSNYVVQLLDTPLLYSLQLALALQRWQATYGTQLGSWLQALGEFEALLSLAGYSYEHPDDPFPQFTGGAPMFDAEGLGHPLLPAAACVRNDVSLGPETALLLISGSNMSGKSTLLRTVGTNAVLAFAGAPVRARRLVLSPLTIAASIHVNDSLAEGKSRFYAEILRLRAVADASRTHPPVLFLLDELLAGTNSPTRSRRVSCALTIGCTQGR